MKQITALLAFVAAAFGPNFLPVLPSGLIAVLVIISLFLTYFVTRRVWVLAFALGFGWGIFQALNFNSQILPKEFDAQIFLISATIKSETTRENGSQRLELQIHELKDEHANVLSPHPQKALVNWYGDEQLAVGDQVLAEAKLRRPRGLQNPGLFDYQKWLIADGFAATGYLRQIAERQAHRETLSGFSRWRLDRMRAISDDASLRYGGIHRALALGDGSEIDADLWALFRNTGTVHLMVISGLHVGLLAGIGYMLGFGLGRCLSAITSCNAVRVGIIFSLGSAFLYCVLSGFGLPATRAFIMLLAFLLPRYFYLRVSHWLSFCFALALVSLVEPRAVLQSGFWLSFGAVLLLFLGFSGNTRGNYLFALIRTQILFLFGFSGVLLWQGLPVPSASLPANLVAVPLTSFILVPLEMLALLSGCLSECLGQALWLICDWLVDLQVQYLRRLEEVDLPTLVRPANWGLIHGSAVIASLLLCAMPGARLRLALALGCLPLFFLQQETDYILRVRVFDVGQGTSVLVQQPNYSLLYDTGPRFSEHFDSGAHIIVPSLEQMRTSVIDRLIVSHPDSDHRGGAEGVLSHLGVLRMDVGSELNLPNNQSLKQHRCVQGESWQREDVNYRYLWPDAAGGRSSNDSSCVLLIEAGEFTVLIPGDISATVEKQLLKELAYISELDLMIIPHHGSKTSSSPSFVRALSPEIAVVSAGYRNRFNHPHPDVVERYVSARSKVLNTADVGAIDILWVQSDAAPKVTLAANSKIFWWQK